MNICANYVLGKSWSCWVLACVWPQYVFKSDWVMTWKWSSTTDANCDTRLPSFLKYLSACELCVTHGCVDNDLNQQVRLKQQTWCFGSLSGGCLFNLLTIFDSPFMESKAESTKLTQHLHNMYLKMYQIELWPQTLLDRLPYDKGYGCVDPPRFIKYMFTTHFAFKKVLHCTD